MNIELILWGYGVRLRNRSLGRPGQGNFWIDTLVKRYKDRPNLFMYTVANEFEHYPDDVYRYSPDDVDWVKRVAARIRRLDKVHPIGAHPSHWIDLWVYKDGPISYKGFTQRYPQVVWPLWEGSDVNLNVTQNNEGVQRRDFEEIGGHTALAYYPRGGRVSTIPPTGPPQAGIFEAPGLEDSIAEDWAHGKPVLDTEFGYQYERGGEGRSAINTTSLPARARRRGRSQRPVDISQLVSRVPGMGFVP